MTTQVVPDAALPPLYLLYKKRCWGIAAGAGTGSTFTLHFGSKLPRIRVIKNAAIQPELRTHEGEALLFVECDWSLSQRAKRLFDTSRDADSTKEMLRALKLLSGASLIRIDMTVPPTVVSFTFSNDAILALNTEEARNDDVHDNFTFSYGSVSYVVGPDRRLRLEPRNGIIPTLPAFIDPITSTPKMQTHASCGARKIIRKSEQRKALP